MMEGVQYYRLEDRLFLLPRNADGEPRAPMELNKTGRKLVRMLQKESTMDELVAELLEDYEVAPEVLRADLEDFFGKLREMGVLEE